MSKQLNTESVFSLVCQINDMSIERKLSRREEKRTDRQTDTQTQTHTCTQVTNISNKKISIKSSRKKQTTQSSDPMNASLPSPSIRFTTLHLTLTETEVVKGICSDFLLLPCRLYRKDRPISASYNGNYR